MSRLLTRLHRFSQFLSSVLKFAQRLSHTGHSHHELIDLAGRRGHEFRLIHWVKESRRHV
jgi:hypothetical protein